MFGPSPLVSYPGHMPALPSPSSWPTILFDVDGTLVQSGDLIMDSFQEALTELGLDPLPEGTLSQVVGPPLIYSFEHFAGVRPQDLGEAVRTYRRIYVPHFLEPPVYPGIRSLLEDLSSAGVHLGTATSKMEKMARAQLEHLELDRFFHVIAGATPDPTSTKSAVVADALRRLDAKGARLDPTVLVGDRSHDVEGAEDNQIKVIGAGWGYGTAAEFDSPAVVAVADSVDSLRSLLL